MSNRPYVELTLLWSVCVVCLHFDRWRGWRRWRSVARICVADSFRPVWSTGLATLACCVIVGAAHLPAPAVHDEFAYLLAGDTFAHGRLTNPAHPLWRFLEVPHVIHQPTYQAKYPPLQGVVLAVGQVVFQRPIVGVWLSYALACAAVVWMLEAWMPRRWAWLGGWLCLGNACMTLGWMPGYTGQFGRLYSSGWGQSYWGGAVAMLGGALVFGALPRWTKSGLPLHAACFAAGSAILAHSRPYEGCVALIVPVLCCCAALPRLLQQRPGRVVVSTISAAGVVACAAFAGLSYNHAVTGDFWKMPYQVWKETYSQGSLATTLLWSGVARNENMARKLLIAWEFFIRAPLLLPLVVGIVLAARRGAHPRAHRWAVAACLLVFGAVLLENTQGHPHYLAPIVAPLIAVCVQGMRQLWVVRVGEARWGRAIVRGTLLVYASIFLFDTAESGLRHPVPPSWEWSTIRRGMQQNLEACGGQHLVFVRYHDTHVWGYEWAYNGAAIDESPVVWVKARDAADNAVMRRYFDERVCWTVSADDPEPKLVPFENSVLSRHVHQTAPPQVPR